MPDKDTEGLVERPKGLKLYNKDNYDVLLKDLNKLVDKFVECEPIEDCYLDLDFLERKGMLKLCYTNISNSFEEYAKELLEQKQKRDKEKEDAIKLQRKKEQKNLIRDEIISNKGRTPKRKNKINSTKKTSN